MEIIDENPIPTVFSFKKSLSHLNVSPRFEKCSTDLELKQNQFLEYLLDNKYFLDFQKEYKNINFCDYSNIQDFLIPLIIHNFSSFSPNVIQMVELLCSFSSFYICQQEFDNSIYCSHLFCLFHSLLINGFIQNENFQYLSSILSPILSFLSKFIECKPMESLYIIQSDLMDDLLNICYEFIKIDPFGIQENSTSVLEDSIYQFFSNFILSIEHSSISTDQKNSIQFNIIHYFFSLIIQKREDFYPTLTACFYQFWSSLPEKRFVFLDERFSEVIKNIFQSSILDSKADIIAIIQEAFSIHFMPVFLSFEDTIQISKEIFENIHSCSHANEKSLALSLSLINWFISFHQISLETLQKNIPDLFHLLSIVFQNSSFSVKSTLSLIIINAGIISNFTIFFNQAYQVNQTFDNVFQPFTLLLDGLKSFDESDELNYDLFFQAVNFLAHMGSIDNSLKNVILEKAYAINENSDNSFLSQVQSLFIK